ncbi:MAG: hypothetical protein DLM60_12525 [Pseudonocardiales bacterium]|nr:MAG: hypothetical protein DLM60_12525 [Pseudonocardiales bacterium]
MYVKDVDGVFTSDPAVTNGSPAELIPRIGPARYSPANSTPCPSTRWYSSSWHTPSTRRRSRSSTASPPATSPRPFRENT